MICHQPRPDVSGRLVYHGGQVVRCGKPAGWTCSTCSKGAADLCEACAHSFGHFPRPLSDEGSAVTTTDATKGSVTRGWPARGQSGSDVRPGGSGVLVRQRSAGQRRTR